MTLPAAEAADPAPPVAQPEPVAPAASAAIPGDVMAPAEFQRRLLEAVAARNAYGLHTTLLETCLVSLTDSAFVLGARPNDRYTMAHLDTNHNQTMLREIAQEITGREMSVRVQPVQEFERPFTAVAVPGSTMPPPAPPARKAAPRPAAAGPAPAAATQAAASAPPAPVRGGVQADGPAADASESDAPRRVIFTAELKHASKVPVKGSALRQLLEKHADLQELVDKVKAAFKVDDAQITFSRSIV